MQKMGKDKMGGAFSFFWGGWGRGLKITKRIVWGLGGDDDGNRCPLATNKGEFNIENFPFFFFVCVCAGEERVIRCNFAFRKQEKGEEKNPISLKNQPPSASSQTLLGENEGCVDRMKNVLVSTPLFSPPPKKRKKKGRGWKEIFLIFQESHRPFPFHLSI